jgi:hypothetical protein
MCALAIVEAKHWRSAPLRAQAVMRMSNAGVIATLSSKKALRNQMRELKIEVLRRDAYCCVFCGTQGVRFNVHLLRFELRTGASGRSKKNGATSNRTPTVDMVNRFKYFILYVK